MPETPTSYEALVVAYAIEQLAACATFQTLTGTASAAAAKARIVDGWGGWPADNAGRDKATNALGDVIALEAPFAEAHSTAFDRQQVALAEYGHRGEVTILVVAAAGADELPPDVMRRGRNLAGAIAAEFQAQFGTVGRLLAGDVRVEGPSAPDETFRTFDFLLTVAWRDVV